MLSRLGFETAALDAKRLTGHVLGLDGLQMASREQDGVSERDAGRVAELIQRRMSGESVARIIGEREFYGLPFRLGPATLEPRPETELLVDFALQCLPPDGRLLDLGTGSGCIPIAILANRSDATAIATDLSLDALDMARANAERNGAADRLTFAHGSWFEALTPTPALLLGEEVSAEVFDLITSNPPYISTAIVDTLSPEVKHFDPRLALDGGPDGLAPYRIIAAQAPGFLRPGGTLLLEIGYDQGEAVTNLLAGHGFAGIAVHKDLNGLDRVVMAHHFKDS